MARTAKVLILGASRGIGAELVRQYLQEGAHVMATARDEAALARLREAGAEALRLDVADPASVSGLAWALEGEKLDVALHVAGVSSHGDATQPPTREAFDAVMHANVLGPMQVMAQVAPLVEAAGGRFGFISSDMGRITDVAGSQAWLYRVSKAALNMAVASARHSYPGAILVALHPGWVQTAMGGEQAPVTVADSARGLRDTLARLQKSDSGAFYSYDGSRIAGW